MTITGDVFLFFLGILALVLMSISNRNILFAFASSLIWFSLFMWMFFSDTPPLDTSKTWVQTLTYAFIILTFMPWIIRIDTEIRNEAKGKRWSTWGTAPVNGPQTVREKYFENRKKYRRILR